MNSPKNFLKIIGYILIVGAVLGFIGILGPTPGRSIFGTYWWLSERISLIYLVTGIVSLYSAYAMPASITMPLAFGLGAATFFVGLYGLIWSSRILGIDLAGPIGNLFNLIVGSWGVWSVSSERFELMRRCRMGDTEACNLLEMQKAR